MSKELINMSPEGLEVATKYLELGNITDTAAAMQLPIAVVTSQLNSREVKKFIDNVFLDTGYRNRNKLGNLLDEILESKVEEARETGMYSKKDMLEVAVAIHKMRMDEIKAIGASEQSSTIRNQTNVQINDGLPSGNYGDLMRTLINNDNNK